MLPCYASSWISSCVKAASLLIEIRRRIVASGPCTWLTTIRQTITRILPTLLFDNHHNNKNQRHVIDGRDWYTMETLSSDPPNEPRHRPESIDISRILLQSGPNSPRQPPPSERISSSPTTRTSLESVQASTTSLSHSRSMSFADSSRQNKRLSLSFPVQQPNSQSSRPPSWTQSPLKSPVDAVLPTEGNFLTVLAAQERRVLELKDELLQAELELERLKKHYASQEATKKRSDVRRLQQLQPLSANLTTLETAEEDVDGSSQWMTKEMERRKTLLRGIKTSNRKVFSGSRHTRTLSLLSPEKGSYSQPFPQPTDLRRSDSVSSHSPALVRSSTISDLGLRPAPSSSDSIGLQLDGAQTKDAIMRTGKQMAFDLKDGLMTFFEDIRQATVGDEGGTIRATQRQPNRSARGGRSNQLNRTASARSARNKDRSQDTFIDIGGSFWRDHGMGMDSPQAKPKGRTASKSMSAPRDTTPVKTQSDDEWDNWGTPIKRTPSGISPPSSEEGSMASSDAHSTPLTSVGGRDSRAQSTERTLTPQTRSSNDVKRDSIPWPSLDKLPSNLKRTASHLMKEWEKSLTPSAEKVAGEHDSDSGLDYPFSPLSAHSRSQSVSPAPGKIKVKKGD